MISLDDDFVSAAREHRISIDLNDKTYEFAATDATDGSVTADLEVRRDGVVVGYITPYSHSERGAVKATALSTGTPAVFHTVEGAIEAIDPDRLSTDATAG